jgi:hypothetical protein
MEALPGHHKILLKGNLTFISIVKALTKIRGFMKISYWLLLSFLVLSISSCKDDNKEGSFTVHFKAFYDGQPVSMFTSKPFTSPQQLQFSHLSFLISDFVLLDQSSTENLKETELVDLSFDDINSADEGFTIRVDHLPAKNYTGLRFGIGVPPDQNAKNPADFPSNHPLSNSGYYWQAWNSYIFMKTEGHIDTLGTGAFDLGFAFHTGTDELYRIVSSAIPITIEDGQNKEIDIRLDYKDLLEGIDIKANPQNSNPSDSVQIGQIVTNLANALTLVQ